MAAGEPGLLMERLAESGIRTITLQTLTRDVALKGEWAAFKELSRVIREERPDILHVNSSKAGLAILAGRFAGVPRILFTAHGFAFNEDRPWWQGLILRSIYAMTILLAHRTICVSSAIRHDMSWIPFLGHKLIVIHNGINEPHFHSVADARAQLPSTIKSTRIGMLAELHPTKRIADALYALADLKDSHPDIALYVIGEGSERERLEELAQRIGLSDRVFLVGFKQDAATLLPAFDIFLAPSRTEALSYALIEAGYAGVPSIASRVGGMKEIIRHKDSGLLVPPENPHTLARAIRQLIEDPAYARALGDKLRETVRARFSKAHMLEATLAVYDAPFTKNLAAEFLSSLVARRAPAVASEGGDDTERSELSNDVGTAVTHEGDGGAGDGQEPQVNATVDEHVSEEQQSDTNSEQGVKVRRRTPRKRKQLKEEQPVQE